MVNTTKIVNQLYHWQAIDNCIYILVHLSNEIESSVFFNQNLIAKAMQCKAEHQTGEMA